MAQAREWQLPPTALTATYTTNIVNPPTTTGGVPTAAAPYTKTRIIIRHIRVFNKTGSGATFRLFRDATGGNTAGKELAYDKNVPANDGVDLYYPAGLELTTADFLVGGASAGTTLTIVAYGQINVDG